MNWTLIIGIAVCTVIIVSAVAVYYATVTRRTKPKAFVVPAKMVRVVRQRTRQRQAERDQAPLGIVREMNAVVDDFIQSHDWKLLLRLASVYEHGSYPVFRSNQEIARMMYMAIATMCPDGIIAMHAQGRVVLRLEAKDDVGDELPPEPAYRAIAELRRVSEQIIADREYAYMHMEDDPVLMMVLSTIPIAFDDDQNVHDHGVVASLRQRASSSSTQGIGAQEKVMDAIVQREDIPEDIRADAVHFLSEHIDDEHHVGLNTSTEKALDVVWQRIQNIEDPELKGNALDTLARQMADGYNHGHVVCPTGRIARILGALDGVVDDVQPVKPSWAIKEEIASLAARYSEEARGPEAFEEKVLKTYVEDLGMNPDVVRPYVDMYKEHVQG